MTTKRMTMMMAMTSFSWTMVVVVVVDEIMWCGKVLWLERSLLGNGGVESDDLLKE